MRMLAGALCFAASTCALAQPQDALPMQLSGHWTAVVPGVRTIVDSLSFSFDQRFPPGPVTGRLTFRGPNCGALDEPASGTWNGSELRLETKHRPNVNAQRVNGQCGSGNVTYVLVRKPGASAFEGDARLDGGAAVIQVSVAP